MKINLHQSSTASRERQQWVVSLIKEMLTEYSMPHYNQNMFYFASDKGSPEFIQWLSKNKGLNATWFEFKDGDTVLAMGFDFEDNESLTRELLAL